MIVIDIETMVDYEDVNYNNYKTSSKKKKKNEDVEDTTDFALHPITGKISAIGIMSDLNILNLNDKIDDLEGYGTHYYRILTTKDNTEKQILAEAWRSLEIHTHYFADSVVTYNGKEFDIPFMIRRSVILGINKPEKLNIQAISSRYAQQHIDLFEVLHTYKEALKFKYIKMHEWCYRLGIVDTITDDTGNGAVIHYPNMGLWADLERHLLMDLVKTSLLYHKLKEWL